MDGSSFDQVASSNRTNVIATSLAATFNLFAILLMCFMVLPSIELANKEVLLNRKEILKSRASIAHDIGISNNNSDKLDQTLKILERIEKALAKKQP